MTVMLSFNTHPAPSAGVGAPRDLIRTTSTDTLKARTRRFDPVIRPTSVMTQTRAWDE